MKRIVLVCKKYKCAKNRLEWVLCVRMEEEKEYLDFCRPATKFVTKIDNLCDFILVLKQFHWFFFTKPLVSKLNQLLTFTPYPLPFIQYPLSLILYVIFYLHIFFRRRSFKTRHHISFVKQRSTFFMFLFFHIFYQRVPMFVFVIWRSQEVSWFLEQTTT